jgi:zinc protease
MRMSRLLSPAAVLVLVGCGGATPAPTATPEPAPRAAASAVPPDDPFEGTAPPDQRQPPPPPGLSPSWSFPAIAKAELANHLELRVVERHNLPLVDVQLVVLSGTATDEGKPGLALVAGELLKAGGAGKWNSRALLDHAESLGASISVVTDRDATTISMSVLKDQFEQALGVIAAVATEPRFDYGEFNKLKRREMDRVESQARSDAGWAASMVLYRELYELPTARHPYARYDATSEELDKVRLEDCRAWHKAHFTPSNSVLVVSGDVTATDARAAVEKTLGKWKGDRPTKPSFSQPLPPAALEIFLVDRPKSPQAEVYVGTLGPHRQSEVWPTLRVANQILGGGVAGRLFLDVREKRSLAYRTNSSVVSVANGPVPIVLAAGTQTAKAGLALDALLQHFESIGKTAPSDEEVGIATRYLSDVFLLSVDTVGSVGNLVAHVVVNGLPDDYYDEYRKAVREVTGTQVLGLAQKYFGGTKAVAVIAGDAERLGKPLSHFGKIIVVDPEKGFSVKKEIPHDPSASIELERERGT